MTTMLSNFVHQDAATKQLTVKLDYVNQMFSLEILNSSGATVFKQKITLTEQYLEKELEPGKYRFRILENNIITREQELKIS
jgi:hypothetical protein